MSLAKLKIDPILYRRTYLEMWVDVTALDRGFAEPELVDAITLVAIGEASARQRVILARNLVHDHMCPFTTWHCEASDPLALARHRRMYRGQALRMLTTIERLLRKELDDTV
tara:strand:+ start:826 stop:1161 length:336 start_codon:yes stop_codon:yes gene_type:complete